MDAAATPSNGASQPWTGSTVALTNGSLATSLLVEGLLASTAASAEPPLDGVWPTAAVVVASVITTVSLVGIAGNGLVVFVIVADRDLKEHVSNVMIGNLAVTDMGTCVLVMLPAVASLASGGWPLGDALCRLHCGLNYLFIIVSMMTLALVSLDRKMAVDEPLKYIQQMHPKRMVLPLIIIWLVGVVFGAVPMGLSWIQYDQWEAVCAIQWFIHDGAVTYVIVAFCVCFLLPAGLIIWSNHVIVRTSQRVSQRGRRPTASSKRRTALSLCRLVDSRLSVSELIDSTHNIESMFNEFAPSRRRTATPASARRDTHSEGGSSPLEADTGPADVPMLPMPAEECRPSRLQRVAVGLREPAAGQSRRPDQSEATADEQNAPAGDAALGTEPRALGGTAERMGSHGTHSVTVEMSDAPAAASWKNGVFCSNGPPNTNDNGMPNCDSGSNSMDGAFVGLNEQCSRPNSNSSMLSVVRSRKTDPSVGKADPSVGIADPPVGKTGTQNGENGSSTRYSVIFSRNKGICLEPAVTKATVVPESNGIRSVASDGMAKAVEGVQARQPIAKDDHSVNVDNALTPSQTEELAYATTLNSDQKRHLARSHRRIVRSIAIVVAIFFICMTPFCVTKLVKIAFQQPGLVPGWVNLLASVVQFTASATNPFIYGFFRPDFKLAFLRVSRKLRNTFSW
ncbi:5-hydroxytryptamine receptor 2A-like [Pollicipes pollicipes]|uniref:5-hydroxytryptamine receptor 2A-like n=1 Tax=Pollicipes pollicipes TaxID=41117 RepID=UPI001885A229|nr:5-hydroxytryptamine receptor 2A-like [Pollicipes pollicipes]